MLLVAVLMVLSMNRTPPVEIALTGHGPADSQHVLDPTRAIERLVGEVAMKTDCDSQSAYQVHPTEDRQIKNTESSSPGQPHHGDERQGGQDHRDQNGQSRASGKLHGRLGWNGTGHLVLRAGHGTRLQLLRYESASPDAGQATVDSDYLTRHPVVGRIQQKGDEACHFLCRADASKRVHRFGGLSSTFIAGESAGQRRLDKARSDGIAAYASGCIARGCRACEPLNTGLGGSDGLMIGQSDLRGTGRHQDDAAATLSPGQSTGSHEREGRLQVLVDRLHEFRFRCLMSGFEQDAPCQIGGVANIRMFSEKRRHGIEVGGIQDRGQATGLRGDLLECLMGSSSKHQIPALLGKLLCQCLAYSAASANDQGLGLSHEGFSLSGQALALSICSLNIMRALWMCSLRCSLFVFSSVDELIFKPGFTDPGTSVADSKGIGGLSRS